MSLDRLFPQPPLPLTDTEKTKYDNGCEASVHSAQSKSWNYYHYLKLWELSDHCANSSGKVFSSVKLEVALHFSGSVQLFKPTVFQLGYLSRFPFPSNRCICPAFVTSKSVHSYYPLDSSCRLVKQECKASSVVFIWLFCFFQLRKSKKHSC